jgi:hypothetical protein
MGRLIYSLNVSLDGFVETPEHGLEWATVDDELHRSRHQSDNPTRGRPHG